MRSNIGSASGPNKILNELPRIAFVLFAFNQERYIREAIESAFSQTHSPLKIILSDDHSTDGTFQIIADCAEGYQGEHQVIVNRNENNLGLTRHIDFVVRMASSDFVVFAAGDDISHPERTQNLVEAWLASGRTAKAVYSGFKGISLEGETLLHRTTPAVRVDDLELIVRDSSNIYGSTSGYSCDLWEHYGGLGRLYKPEDRTLAYRAAASGHITFLPAELVAYRTGGISSSEDDPVDFDSWLSTRLKRTLTNRNAYLQTLKDIRKDIAHGKRVCQADRLERIAISKFESTRQLVRLYRGESVSRGWMNVIKKCNASDIVNVLREILVVWASKNRRLMKMLGKADRLK